MVLRLITMVTVALASLLPGIVLGAEEMSPQTYGIVAVRGDRDEAIGIARLYNPRDPSVVKRLDGAFEVLLGPYGVETVDEFRSYFARTSSKPGASGQTPPLPAGFTITKREAGDQTVWQAGPSGENIYFFNGNEPVGMSRDGLSVSIAIEKGTRGGDATIRFRGDGGALDLSLKAEAPLRPLFFSAHLTWLDRAAPYPQVVLDRALQGYGADVGKGRNSILSQTLIATKLATGWTLVDTGIRRSHIDFFDIDGHGEQALTMTDPDVLPSFDGGVDRDDTVDRIERLEGDRLVDVTGEPLGQAWLRQRLGALEFKASLEPDRWHADAFLVVWLATKARLNDFAGAWTTMLDRYDPNPNRTDAACAGADDRDSEPCPQMLKHQLPFPERLAYFLRAAGFEFPADLDGIPHPASTATLIRTAADSVYPDPDLDPATPPGAILPRARVKGAAFSGSAVLLVPSLFLTTAHSVGGCIDVAVKLGDEIGNGRVLIYSDNSDLAIIGTTMSSIDFAPPRIDPQFGEAVGVFGYDVGALAGASDPKPDAARPTGPAVPSLDPAAPKLEPGAPKLEPEAAGRFQLGNIAALGGVGDDARYLQASVPASADASGAAVFDTRGNLLGIVDGVTNKLVDGIDINPSMTRPSFVIRVEAAKELLESLGISWPESPAAPALSGAALESRARAVTARVLCEN